VTRTSTRNFSIRTKHTINAKARLHIFVRTIDAFDDSRRCSTSYGIFVRTNCQRTRLLTRNMLLQRKKRDMSLMNLI